MRDLFDIFTTDSALVPTADEGEDDTESYVPTADEAHEARVRYEALRDEGTDESVREHLVSLDHAEGLRMVTTKLSADDMDLIESLMADEDEDDIDEDEDF